MEVADQSLVAYQRCADYYDVVTAEYDYGTWLDGIERVALEHGLHGRRVLDVACGTGKSAEPLADRGYDVWACDQSPAMVARARERLGPKAHVFLADMRRLPETREHDLITCLDDSLNYVLDDVQLTATLEGFSRSLAPDGLAIFDLNSRAAYRDFFTAGRELELAGNALTWHGRTPPGGSLFEAEITPARRHASWRPSLHIQRHHSREQIAAACVPAGLEIVAVYGQSSARRLSQPPDELDHRKLLYVIRKRARTREGIPR